MDKSHRSNDKESFSQYKTIDEAENFPGHIFHSVKCVIFVTLEWIDGSNIYSKYILFYSDNEYCDFFLWTIVEKLNV